METLTVKQLIARLLEFDEALPVVVSVNGVQRDIFDLNDAEYSDDDGALVVTVELAWGD